VIRLSLKIDLVWINSGKELKIKDKLFWEKSKDEPVCPVLGKNMPILIFLVELVFKYN
jgi:hypothetical protein